MARKARIKQWGDGQAIYHCVSRTVNKEKLWGETAKGVFQKQLHKVAAFCGVQVLAYCIMTNHFHVLVRITPGASAVLTNEQLIERLRLFYTNPKDAFVLAELEAGLRADDPRISQSTRRMLLARMDDVSNFMKILKQRFSIWFNRNHQRWGTHWGERFRSVLLENSRSAVLMVAAYIVLNPVRAGICQKPEAYRYCSYADALSGNAHYLQSLMEMTGEQQRWVALQAFTDFMRRQTNVEKEAKETPNSTEASPTVNLTKKQTCISSSVAIGSASFLEQFKQWQKYPETRRTRTRNGRYPAPGGEFHYLGKNLSAG